MLLSLLLLTQDAVCRWICENWLELFGAVSGLLYIYLEVRQKSSMWVVGFINSAVYVVVFFRSKLYADSALYVYYVAASVYGMYCWSFARQPDGEATTDKRYGRSISRLDLRTGIVLALISAVLYAGTGYVLDRYTDSPVPYYDALIPSLSFVATWMLARKILEHWLVWILVNSYSLGLYLWRELYPTAGLFAVFGIMSVVGWFKWKQSLNSSTQ